MVGTITEQMYSKLCKYNFANNCGKLFSIFVFHMSLTLCNIWSGKIAIQPNICEYSRTLLVWLQGCSCCVYRIYLLIQHFVYIKRIHNRYLCYPQAQYNLHSIYSNIAFKPVTVYFRRLLALGRYSGTSIYVYIYIYVLNLRSRSCAYNRSYCYVLKLKRIIKLYRDCVRAYVSFNMRCTLVYRLLYVQRLYTKPRNLNQLLCIDKSMLKEYVQS